MTFNVNHKVWVQLTERGRNVLDVDYDIEQIKSAAEFQIRHGRYDSNKVYGDGKAGERISQLLALAPLGIEKRLAY